MTASCTYTQRDCAISLARDYYHRAISMIGSRQGKRLIQVERTSQIELMNKFASDKVINSDKCFLSIFELFSLIEFSTLMIKSENAKFYTHIWLLNDVNLNKGNILFAIKK